MARFTVEAPAVIGFVIEADTEKEACEKASDLIDSHGDLDGYQFKVAKGINARVSFHLDIKPEDIEVTGELD